MVNDTAVADEINSLMLDVASRINESIAMVQTRCPEAEFRGYQLAAGKVMGEILVEILNPLYRLHPNLRPPDLKV
jgi:hypothetical protein